MIAVINASLSVQQVNCDGTKTYTVPNITEIELKRKGRTQDVKIFGLVVEPNNKMKTRIYAVWNPDFNALMPKGNSNYFDRIFVCNTVYDDIQWTVKCFKNIFKRQKIFLEEKTIDINKVQKWLKERDAVKMIAKKGRLVWKDVQIIAINEQYVCTSDGKLLKYKIK